MCQKHTSDICASKPCGKPTQNIHSNLLDTAAYIVRAIPYHRTQISHQSSLKANPLLNGTPPDSAQVLQACMEVSSQLEDTTLAKVTAMREFAIACYLKILTPLQVARGELYSCPHIMDITAVAGCLGECHLNGCQ